MKKSILVLFVIIIFSASGCNESISATALFLTSTPEPEIAVSTSTYTPVPTNTVLPTVTATAIPTQAFQVLTSIFPAKYNSQAIWTNAGGGNDPKQSGWIQIGTDFAIHFDVLVPTNFDESDKLISPVDGTLVGIYEMSDQFSSATFYSMEIKLNHIPSGIERIFENKSELDFLSHEGLYPFTYSPSDISSVSITIGHLGAVDESISTRTPEIKQGQQIATIDTNQVFRPKKIGYALVIRFIDGRRYDFSPCLVDNLDSFCGNCAPGALRCP
jgi:hypothetical protein